MDRQRRLRIAALFEEAMDLPPEKQARFLDREWGDDMELRREVQKLFGTDGTEPRREASHPPAPHLAERSTELVSPGRSRTRQGGKDCRCNQEL